MERVLVILAFILIAVCLGALFLLAVDSINDNRRKKKKREAAPVTHEDLLSRKIREDLRYIRRYADPFRLTDGFVNWFGKQIRKDLSSVSIEEGDRLYRIWTLVKGVGSEYIVPSDIAALTDVPLETLERDIRTVRRAVEHLAQSVTSALGLYDWDDICCFDLRNLPMECRYAFTRSESWAPKFPGPEANEVEIIVNDPTDERESYIEGPCVYLAQTCERAEIFGEHVEVRWQGPGFYVLEGTEERYRLVAVVDGPTSKKEIPAWANLVFTVPEAFRIPECLRKLPHIAQED